MRVAGWVLIASVCVGSSDARADENVTRTLDLNEPPRLHLSRSLPADTQIPLTSVGTEEGA